MGIHYEVPKVPIGIDIIGVMKAEKSENLTLTLFGLGERRGGYCKYRLVRLTNPNFQHPIEMTIRRSI